MCRWRNDLLERRVCRLRRSEPTLLRGRDLFRRRNCLLERRLRGVRRHRSDVLHRRTRMRRRKSGVRDGAGEPIFQHLRGVRRLRAALLRHRLRSGPRVRQSRHEVRTVRRLATGLLPERHLPDRPHLHPQSNRRTLPALRRGWLVRRA
jgi:hypothetical protein